MKLKFFHWTSPVEYGHSVGSCRTVPSRLRSPQSVCCARVVIDSVLLATATAPATLHSVSLWAYSPCLEMTVHAELRALPLKSSEKMVPGAAGGGVGGVGGVGSGTPDS